MLRLSRICRRGEAVRLAAEANFTEQRSRAAEVLDWYRQFVELLRRLQSGVTPTILQDYCGGGGSSEGVRRGGSASHGIDIEPQPDHVRRFGAEGFTLGDGASRALVADVSRRCRALGAIAGPPCKRYSTADVRGLSRAPMLIDHSRPSSGAVRLVGH